MVGYFSWQLCQIDGGRYQPLGISAFKHSHSWDWRMGPSHCPTNIVSLSHITRQVKSAHTFCISFSILSRNKTAEKKKSYTHGTPNHFHTMVYVVGMATGEQAAVKLTARLTIYWSFATSGAIDERGLGRWVLTAGIGTGISSTLQP